MKKKIKALWVRVVRALAGVEHDKDVVALEKKLLALALYKLLLNAGAGAGIAALALRIH